MCFAALGGLESDRADGALVEDLAVFLFDVTLLSVESLEHHVTVETPVPGPARVVQAVLLDVLLYVGGAAQGAALGAAVRGLVGVKALVSSEAALVGQQHGADFTY